MDASINSGVEKLIHVKLTLMLSERSKNKKFRINWMRDHRVFNDSYACLALLRVDIVQIKLALGRLN